MYQYPPLGEPPVYRSDSVQYDPGAGAAIPEILPGTLPATLPEAFPETLPVPPATPPKQPVRHPRAPGGESPLIRHNHLGESYSIKLVYPGFYLSINHRDLTSMIGFPLAKEKLAKKVQPGHLFFIYVTSPERRVIGLAQAVSAAMFTPERDYRRPWTVDLVWVLGPKMPGIQFTDIGLQIKARVGDSTYSITDEVAAVLIDRLQDMASLSQMELARQRERYRMFV